jgi:hypothetical protein
MNVKPLGSDAERVTVVVKNVSGATVEKGMGVAWPTAANNASLDGVSVAKSAAALAAGFVGVATADIADNGYGIVVCWGDVDSVLISHEGTSLTLTRGDTLKYGAVAGTFASSVTAQAMSTLLYKYVVACTTPVALSAKATSYVRGLVRAL